MAKTKWGVGCAEGVLGPSDEFGEVVEQSRFGLVFVGLVEPSGRARVGVEEQQGDHGAEHCGAECAQGCP